MKNTTVSVIAFLIPAALCAQVGGQASAQTTASTAARVNGASVSGTANASASGEFRAPDGFSAAGAAKLNAMYADAAAHHVPRQPMANRVAEGRAKGAGEARVIASAGHVKANLIAAHDAMVAGGRKQPSDEECERGAAAMERGATRAQIEATARRTAGDRSLVVAFNSLNATAGNAAVGATAATSATVTTKPVGTTLSTTVGGVVRKP